jgi:magnesium transporter
VIVDCAVYTNGRRRVEHLELADAFEAGRNPDSFVWIGLHEPTPAEFVAVQEELSLHPLAVEDAVRANQHPKLEQYEGTVFAVVKTAVYDDEKEVIVFGEIHLFVGDGFVVSVRHGDGNELGSVRRMLEADPAMLARGPAAVLYAVFDRTVDNYQIVVDGIDKDLDELENEVFSDHRPNVTERIFRLKRQVLEFHRAVLPVEEPLMRLLRRQVPLFCSHPELDEYFRDVVDHTRRVMSRIDSARETLATALNANLAQVGVQQNADMRAMSGWAAVIAVPTLLAGIWGMNFKHMPELHWTVGYPLGLVTIFGSGALTRFLLKRNGWM